MRVTSLMAALCVLLLARPMTAQDWKEYENRADRFTVPAPGEPKVETITWDSEYGARFPGRMYRWDQGRTRYSVTVIDYSDAERIHSELNHVAYLEVRGTGRSTSWPRSTMPPRGIARSRASR